MPRREALRYGIAVVRALAVFFVAAPSPAQNGIDGVARTWEQARVWFRNPIETCHRPSSGSSAGQRKASAG